MFFAGFLGVLETFVVWRWLHPAISRQTPGSLFTWEEDRNRQLLLPAILDKGIKHALQKNPQPCAHIQQPRFLHLKLTGTSCERTPMWCNCFYDTNLGIPAHQKKGQKLAEYKFEILHPLRVAFHAQRCCNQWQPPKDSVETAMARKHSVGLRRSKWPHRSHNVLFESNPVKPWFEPLVKAEADNCIWNDSWKKLQQNVQETHGFTVLPKKIMVFLLFL